jgi:hypothetical protein
VFVTVSFFHHSSVFLTLLGVYRESGVSTRVGFGSNFLCLILSLLIALPSNFLSFLSNVYLRYEMIAGWSKHKRFIRQSSRQPIRPHIPVIEMRCASKFSPYVYGFRRSHTNARPVVNPSRWARTSGAISEFILEKNRSSKWIHV